VEGSIEKDTTPQQQQQQHQINAISICK